MRKGLSVLEILIVLVILIILTLIFFKPGSNKNNPIEEIRETQVQSQIIDDKIQSIEDTKALKEKMEKNLQESY